MEGEIVQFTVIIPIYKVEEYLERCVDSVLAQTFSDFEVILVDDGSPDRCPQICDEYEKKDSRVRVIHKQNGGLVSARNAGIFAAKGDYITYVDGDDWVKPGLLQFVHDRIAESSVPVDMIIFAAEKVFENHSEPMLNHVEEGWYDRERLEREVFPYLLRGFNTSKTISGHTWNKPCRRELQVEHYVRDERIRMFTDLPMTIEIILNCKNVYICNDQFYLYNQTNLGSILSIGKKNYLTESFFHFVSYLQERLHGISPSIDQQLNDVPVNLMIRTGMGEIQKDQSFNLAVRSFKNELRKSGMLKLVNMKGIPATHKLFVVLLKLHLYALAMVLCALNVRKSK